MLTQSPLSNICDPQPARTNLLHDRLPKDVDESRPSTEVVDRRQGEQPARQQTKDALAFGYQAFSLHDPTTQADEIEPSCNRVMQLYLGANCGFYCTHVSPRGRVS